MADGSEHLSRPGDAVSSGDVPYVLPRHPTEVDRLDVQHYALREVFGAHYLAPVERPARVLDVGAGTGQWGYDLCRELPGALVVGFDLVAPKPGEPPGYRSIRGNLLQGLPFADGGFDFVHQRLMLLSVPVGTWNQVVEELVRVLRPGGWLELVEGNTRTDSPGPATERLTELLNQLARSTGVDSTGVSFRDLQEHLTRLNLQHVRRQTFAMPLGDWGGRAGTFMASDCRALFLRLVPVFEAKFGVPTAEGRDLVSRALREWEELHTTYSFAVAYGQKP